MLRLVVSHQGLVALLALCLSVTTHNGCSREVTNPVGPQTDKALSAAPNQDSTSVCTVHDASGRYQLKSDSACSLSFFSGSGELDCQEHKVQGISVYDVH